MDSQEQGSVGYPLPLVGQRDHQFPWTNPQTTLAMEIEIFTLSDYAQDNSGKLTIVGTFDRINVGSFPTNSPPCALAMRMRVANSESGTHELRIRCVDENNVEIPNLNLAAGFNVLPNREADYSGINVVLGLAPMKLERPGSLNFELYIDNEWARAVRLNVVQRGPMLAA